MAEKSNSLTVADFLELPDEVRQFVNWIMREIAFLQAVTRTGRAEKEVHAMLERLLEKGFIKEVPAPGSRRYRVPILLKQGRRVSAETWRRLEDDHTRK